MASTEYVYVCTSNFWRYLYLSMRSLFASGTTVDRVTVYLTDDDGGRMTFDDPRIAVKRVPDIRTGVYWGTNKTHLCDSDADRVVYLDTDTYVLRPIEQLWEGRSEDLIARFSVDMYTRYYNDAAWSAALRYLGAQDFPQYSPGFMIFQNGAHRRLKDTWVRVIEQILAKEIPAIPANKHAELYAFSLAASIEGLSHYAMEESGHRYAMLGEAPDDAVVYHLGTPGFYRHYLPLEAREGLNSRGDLPVPRPPFVKLHAYYTRARHRLKQKMRKGPREASLEY